MDSEHKALSWELRSKRLKIPLLLLITFLSWQCEDVFVVRLDETVVEIKMPVDDLKTPVSTQLFWWVDTYGAEEYHFQIVSPSFDSINSLVKDTFIDTNRIELSLLPGIYQWRVKAKNSGTETPWSTRLLEIDSSLDLSNQNVQLVTPIDLDTTNKSIQELSWQPIYNANQYAVELWHPDLQGSLLYSSYVSNNQVIVSLPNQGNYVWRVKAENSSSSTNFSQRSIYLDSISPNAPTLINPINNSTLTSNQAYFNWIRNSSGGSSIRDSLILAIDTNFVQVDKVVILNSTNYSDSLNSGTYYWRVYSTDKAGNVSVGSEIRRFYVP